MFEPVQHEFFVRGLVAATLVGALCGFTGVYVVLRRLSYNGCGLSHAIFGGAVDSYVMSIDFSSERAYGGSLSHADYSNFG